MTNVLEHPIVNIAPSFPSRYSHDLAEVLEYFGAKKEVYNHECIDVLRKNILDVFSLPKNNREILQAGFNLIGYEAQKYKNEPGYDGTSPETGGFDCSGFICYVLDSVGIDRPSHIRHCREFFFDSYNFGQHIDQKDALPGDIVFYSWDGSKVNHTGIYLGEFFGERYYIHASNARNQVIVTKVSKNENPKESMFPTNPIGYKRVTG